MINIHKQYIEKCHEVAKESVARRLKVGAVLVCDGDVMLTGYNHMPKGYTPECDHEVFTDDYDTLGLESYENVIHAEVQVILSAARSGIALVNTTLYLTDSPCLRCAELIAESGIKTVIYDREYRITDGVDYLKKNGVEVYQVDQIKKIK